MVGCVATSRETNVTQSAGGWRLEANSSRNGAQRSDGTGCRLFLNDLRPEAVMSALCALHFELWTSPFILHSSPFILHSSPFILYSSPFFLHPSPFILYSSPFFLYSSPFILYSLRFWSKQDAFRSQYSPKKNLEGTFSKRTSTKALCQLSHRIVSRSNWTFAKRKNVINYVV